MNDMNAVMRHRAEYLRAIRGNKYEMTDTGIYFPAQKNFIGGVFNTEHRRGGDLIGNDLSPNLLPTAGLNHLLSVLVAGGSQVGTWYMSIFEGNYTPVAGVTAATYPAAATESTAYDESTRVAYVDGTIASGSVSNSASRAEFTINATKTIYGAALHSLSTKSATTGELLAVARFSASRAVVDDDVLAVAYTLSATSS